MNKYFKKFVVLACALVVFYLLQMFFGYLNEIEFTKIKSVEVTFTLVGGLGIFLFGIKFMGDGLKQFAGNRMKDLIQKYTDNPFKGVLVGLLTTVAIQSSSGTTALTIGLVRSGLMSFRQAIGVIMGANIGTTITALLIGLKISSYSLPIMALGGSIFMFTNNVKTRHLSEVIFGFGALFFGLSLMGDALKPIAELPLVSEKMIELSQNPMLAVIVGTIFTVVVQSSSAIIGIIQELYGNGSIELEAAIPLVLGSNIGTTVTAIIAAIGASVAAKRASMFHTLFNIIGAMFFVIILIPFRHLIEALATKLDLNPEMQLAFAHGIFNITITILFFPFIKLLEKLIIKAIPNKDDEIELDTELLSYQLLQESPSLALVQARNAVIYLGKIVERSIVDSKDKLLVSQLPKLEKIYQYESITDSLEKEIQIYLQTMSKSEMAEEDVQEQRLLSMAAKNYERASDHLIHIVEFVQVIVKNKETMSEQQLVHFEKMYLAALEIIQLSIELLETNNVDLVTKIHSVEEMLNELEIEAIEMHYDELRNNTTVGFAAAVYVDLLNSVERIGDCGNIVAKGVRRSAIPKQVFKVADVIV